MKQKQMTMMESLIEDLESNEPNRVSKAIEMLDMKKKVAKSQSGVRACRLATMNVCRIMSGSLPTTAGEDICRC